MVVWSGVKLARYGDALGAQFNLSRTWIGVILLAIVTSLPELVVTLSAQLAVARPGIAMANVCGSNLFNLCIFAIVDVYQGPGALSARLNRRLLKPASMGLLCMGIAFLGLLLPIIGPGEWVAVLGWPVSAAILFVCLLAMWRTERGEKDSARGGEVTEPSTATGGRGTIVRFAATSGLLLASGIGLLVLCDSLIDRPLHIGSASFVLGEMVVGTIGLALVTSLPELVVCVAAVRLGALDMAVGNLLGSNIFNVTMLPLAHAVRPTQAFWSAALPAHCLALGVAMVLTLIVSQGIRRRSKAGILRMGWDAVIVAVLGGATFVVVAVLGVTF